MQTIFKNKKITSMLGVLPEKESFFDDEVNNYTFPASQTMRLKKIMGYEKHRLSKETSTVSDFGTYGLKYMLDNGWIKKEEIGAVICVTLTPDYFVPHVSNLIQGNVGLDTDVLCIDIAQGCCGFILGLNEACMILEHTDKKVVLVNGDLISHKASKADREYFPLCGDGVTLTVIENAESEDIYSEIHMDGKAGPSIIVPAGGLRIPCTSETAALKQDEGGNVRSQDNIYMDGGVVFNFIMKRVPEMLQHAWGETNNTVDSIDWFLFHQPNKFILKKLAQKMKIPFEKMPMDLVEKYGNSDGATIPMTAIDHFSGELVGDDMYNCCLAGHNHDEAWADDSL